MNDVTLPLVNSETPEVAERFKATLSESTKLIDKLELASSPILNLAVVLEPSSKTNSLYLVVWVIASISLR